jgi:hypothetical protein
MSALFRPSITTSKDWLQHHTRGVVTLDSVEKIL